MKKLIAGLAAALLLSFAAFAADDIDGAYNDLKTAMDAKKAPAEIKTLAVAVLGFAAKAPDDAHNKEVAAQAEYALLATGLAATSAADQVALFGALETANPKSEYMLTAYPYYLAALGKAEPAKLGAVVDKALVNYPDNQELLVAGANNALSHQQADKAVSLARKALASKGKKPEGVEQAAWDKSQSQIMGSMHYIIGVVQCSKNQFLECDKELRAALPTSSGTVQGNVYFYLGIANYQLGRQIQSKARVTEGANFSDQAAKIAGPNQSQAFTNAGVMKAEAAKMR